MSDSYHIPPDTQTKGTDTMQRLTSDDYCKSFKNLDFPQKTFIAELIQDAKFDYFRPSPVSKKVIDALENCNLMSDFTETDLVEWAVESELPLTVEGLAVWKRIQAASLQADKNNVMKNLVADLSKALHDEYIHEYEILSAEQKEWLAAFIDTDSTVYHVGGIFKPSPAAYKIHLGFVTGELSPEFSLNELKKFLTINEVPIRHDWRDRLEFIAADASPKADTGKAGATDDTGKDDTGKGYNTLTQDEIRKHKTIYEAERWDTWILKFKNRKDVKPLLNEYFNIKTGKNQSNVMARNMSAKQWERVYKQEYKRITEQEKNNY